MTMNRFGLFYLASLIGITLMSGVAFAQNAPPPQGYPDPNAQPQYPQQQQPPQQYPQQPGYPQQQPGYPPQDYQQQQQQPPQPGYPPQQPGYPPQQPGYPPQQYPQQPGYAPPPGYGTPPGYGPPAGYAPPPPYMPPSGHHGLLAMPYLGINGFAGDTGNGVGPGVRIGGLLGFFASPMFSLNGELSIDFMNLDSNLYPNTSGVRASISIAPLFHLPAGGNLEVVVGPKLGVWDEELSDTSGSNASQSASGYLVGLNAGLFARAGRTWVGGLFTFESATPDKACANDGFSGDSCVTLTNATSEKVLSFDGALMF